MKVKATLEESLKKISDKQLLYYVKLHRIVSLEYVEFVRYELSVCPKNQMGFCSLIRLLKSQKEVIKRES